MATADASVLSVIAETFVLPQADFALILQSPTAFGDIAGNYFQDKRPEITTASPEDTPWFEIQTDDFEGEGEHSKTVPAFTVGTVWARIMPTVSGYRAEAWSESTHQDGLGTPGYQHLAFAADLNNDGLVDMQDLILVASQFGTADATADSE